MKRYVIQIAPLVPLPVLRTQVFSYWHSEDLPVGTLVAAPFYFREIQGVVVKSGQANSGQNSLKLKNIKSVMKEKYLSENQIELARRVAEYYFSPLGAVLKLMIPKVVKQRKNPEKITARKSAAKKIGEKAKKIAESRQNEFLLTGDSRQREKINFDLIGFYVKKNKQCLILVPEIFFAYGVYEKIRKAFSGEIALIHSRITRGQYYDSWKKIKSGGIKIVIASKQGIFLPFADLGLIVVQEEQDISFKQWEAMPRYDARRGAQFLADIAGAKLVLESSAPSVENFYRARTGQLESLDINSGKNNFPSLEIISSEGEKKNPDFPISKTLYGFIADVARKEKQAVIFVNRRGFSTRTTCENCKKVLKCPKCDKPLIYSDEAESYRCLHCAHKIDLLSICPSCGGFQFSHRGIGTQTVEKKIRKLFPSMRVARLDADIMRSSVKCKNILQEFAAGDVDVIVGTQSAVKGIYSDNIELVASISGRDFADGAEFKSRHLALSRLFHMANLSNRNGIVAVQSFFGGNPLFENFNSHDLKKYYERELEVRKKFSYPPFRKFIKLVYRDKSEKKAQSETKMAFDLLVATRDNDIEIVGPYEPVSPRKRGQCARNILIKFDPAKNINDLPIRSVIGGLRKGWTVDVDPVSML